MIGNKQDNKQNNYFETQSHFSLQCGLCAVNNFLGKKQFKKSDFQAICYKLSDQTPNPYKHILGGDYDVSVLIMALEEVKYQIQWHDKRKTIDKEFIKDLEAIDGFLLNMKMPEKFYHKMFSFSGRHWISIKILHEKQQALQILKMDSHEQKPIRLTVQQLIQYLQKQRSSGAQVLKILKSGKSKLVKKQQKQKQILPSQIQSEHTKHQTFNDNHQHKSKMKDRFLTVQQQK